MKLNIKVVFDRRKTATKDREGTIEIYVSQGRKKKYINTGVRVLPKNFKNGMVYGRADAITLNDIIAEKVHQVQSLPFDRVSVDTIDRIHTGAVSFCDWMDEQVEKHNVRESTKRQHRVMARAVRDSKLFKSFDDITAFTIRRFDEQLHERFTNQPTIHGYHKRFKVYVIKAFQNGYIKANPYISMSKLAPYYKGIKDKKAYPTDRLFSVKFLELHFFRPSITIYKIKQHLK